MNGETVFAVPVTTLRNFQHAETLQKKMTPGTQELRHLHVAYSKCK